MAKKVGAVDILFNCAGFVHHGTVLATSDEEWDFSFDINVKSMHRTIRAFLPGMLEQAAPARSSTSPRAPPRPRHAQPLRLRRLEGGGDRPDQGGGGGLSSSEGIRVNAICPGTIESPSLDQRIETQAKALGKSIAEIRQAFVDRQPMGRLGKPEEIAALAVYLAGDESSYTTGQIFLADEKLRRGAGERKLDVLDAAGAFFERGRHPDQRGDDCD